MVDRSIQIRQGERMNVDRLRHVAVVGLAIVGVFFLGGPAFALAGLVGGASIQIEGGPARLLVDVLLGLAALRASRRLWSEPSPREVVF